MKTVTTTVKEGSPMTVESRIFSRPKASLFVPLCLKPETQLSWFGMSIPGRKLRLTFILTAKTRGLFCREWLITFRAMGLFVPSGKVR